MSYIPDVSWSDFDQWGIGAVGAATLREAIVLGMEARGFYMLADWCFRDYFHEGFSLEEINRIVEKIAEDNGWRMSRKLESGLTMFYTPQFSDPPDYRW